MRTDQIVVGERRREDLAAIVKAYHHLTPYERSLGLVTLAEAAARDLREAAPAAPRANWIYFVFASDEGPVKIGTSIDPDRRLGELRRETPGAVLIGVVEGGDAEEAAFHRRFAHLRLHGEWFHADPELLAFVHEQTDSWAAR